MCRRDRQSRTHFRAEAFRGSHPGPKEFSAVEQCRVGRDQLDRVVRKVSLSPSATRAFRPRS
jgi:hypothetical protein